jgi:hypothetical protein
MQYLRQERTKIGLRYLRRIDDRALKFGMKNPMQDRPAIDIVEQHSQIAGFDLILEGQADMPGIDGKRIDQPSIGIIDMRLV